MADDSDVLLKMYEDQWVQARQAEDQRATFTNIIIVIVSLVLGFIAQQKNLGQELLPLTILLIILGIYGAITTAKLYERFQFHVGRARAWRKRIDELHQEARLIELKDAADARHREKYRLNKLRLYILWTTLHIIIALAGVILTVMIIF